MPYDMPSVRASRSEIAIRRMMSVAYVHVSHGPVPDGIELRPVIQLDGYHHAIRHALSAGIVVSPICYIGEWTVGVLAIGEIDRLGLGIAMKELLIGCINS